MGKTWSSSWVVNHHADHHREAGMPMRTILIIENHGEKRGGSCSSPSTHHFLRTRKGVVDVRFSVVGIYWWGVNLPAPQQMCVWVKSGGQGGWSTYNVGEQCSLARRLRAQAREETSGHQGVSWEGDGGLHGQDGKGHWGRWVSLRWRVIGRGRISLPEERGRYCSAVKEVRASTFKAT